MATERMGNEHELLATIVADYANYSNPMFHHNTAKAILAAGFRHSAGDSDDPKDDPCEDDLPRRDEAFAVLAIVNKVRAYADERFRYGQSNRTVGSMRIASDLYAILGVPAEGGD